jgi:hypothetical protein
MSKKFYPVLSITLITLSVVLGYVATSGILSNKKDTAQNSSESKSILVSSSSPALQNISSTNSSQESSITSQVQNSVGNNSSTSESSIEAAVDDGWVLVEPSSPSSDANQIKG